LKSFPKLSLLNPFTPVTWLPLHIQHRDNPCGISDGSPTYVWESERVADIRKVEAFKGMAGGASEACAQ